VHPELVRLGLPEYVRALLDAGHDRLFPELTFNQVKGYGKQAGQWFNERFLGDKLKMPRDGQQTVHSFRHNFITALNRLKPDVPEFTINQLSGHERGATMSSKRYTKDEGPDALREIVDRLSFDIPAVKPFNVSEGT
jgi:integrase